MKLLLPTLIAATMLLSNCKKSSNTVTPINCDGLVTDTLGTGDTGRLYIQNAFTPNHDLLNDAQTVVVRGISSILVTIYDGNNNIAFTTTQLSMYDSHGLASTLLWEPANAATYETYYYRVQATTTSNHHIGACGLLYKLACLPSNIPISSLHFEDQLLINGTYDPTTHEQLPVCP